MGRATRQRSVAYTGHLGTVYSVAWSPDGRPIASGGNDSTVQVWDAMSGRRLLTYHGHAAAVRQVTWSPDGTRLASASKDGTAQIWEATSGKQLLTSGGHTILAQRMINKYGLLGSRPKFTSARKP